MRLVLLALLAAAALPAAADSDRPVDGRPLLADALIVPPLELGDAMPLPSIEPEEAPASDPVEDDAAAAARLVAAGWCVFASDDTSAPGCDMGVGLALHRWGRLSAVAIVGTETLGCGLAWTARRGPGPVIAVGVGVVARYDAAGISTELHPAVGCTLSFSRGEGASAP